MDIISVLLLGLIALAMFLGKPLKVEVSHKHESVTPYIEPKELKQLDKDEIETVNLDEVVKKINEAMGVDIDGRE